MHSGMDHVWIVAWLDGDEWMASAAKIKVFAEVEAVIRKLQGFETKVFLDGVEVTDRMEV